ncbi:unnamed protein product [Adineta steineri]|uniref:Uncharacterized protein n=1 Tax=Adineta steineri TaxID=433720 RepID=A0A813QV51_9BILA|nr:unnamed protein product [Adineta steineri]
MYHIPFVHIKKDSDDVIIGLKNKDIQRGAEHDLALNIFSRRSYASSENELDVFFYILITSYNGKGNAVSDDLNDRPGYMCVFCSTTTRNNERKWLNHIHIAYPDVFKNLVEQLREMHRKKHEESIVSKEVLNTAVENINVDDDEHYNRTNDFVLAHKKS